MTCFLLEISKNVSRSFFYQLVYSFIISTIFFIAIIPQLSLYTFADLLFTLHLWNNYTYLSRIMTKTKNTVNIVYCIFYLYIHCFCVNVINDCNQEKVRGVTFQNLSYETEILGETWRLTFQGVKVIQTRKHGTYKDRCRGYEWESSVFHCGQKYIPFK